jgi:molybdenum cofactor guanylyltransferase
MGSAALTVAILAGGAATRLGGRDKGLEPAGGKALVEWVIDYCAKHVAHDAELIIVANRHRDDYARYAPTYADTVPGFQGPLAGIATALRVASAPSLMTLPVDCPSPPHDLAKRLRTALHHARAPAVVAHDGARRQPLFALYGRHLAESASAAAEQGQGVHQWQDAIGAVEVDFADRRQQFHNLNTPADFAAYADAVRSRD